MVAKTTNTAASMTPEQADFAARFADYEIVTRVGKEEKDPILMQDGQFFHVGGTIKVTPRLQRITVYAVRGAEAKMLEQMIQNAKEFRDGGRWAESLSFTTEYANGHEWYLSGWIGRYLPTAEPASPFRVVACTDGHCIETWHEYDAKTALGTPIVFHKGESIRPPQGGYTVTMVRMTAEDWRLEVDIDPFDLNVFAARSLANDINWLSVECDKLNSTEAVAA